METNPLLTRDALNNALRIYMKNVILEGFIDKFKNYIEVNQIQKNELAEVIGVSPSYVGQILRYNKTPNIDLIAKLTLALDMDVEIDLKYRGAKDVQQSVERTFIMRALDSEVEAQLAHDSDSIFSGNPSKNSDFGKATGQNTPFLMAS